MSTSPTAVAQKNRPDSKELEFIRGNRDGPQGTHDTYTVCRIKVSQERLDEEMMRGLHPHFVSGDVCWDCPGHMLLKVIQKARKRAPAKDKWKFTPPSAVAIERWKKSGHDKSATEALEVVQKNATPPGQEPTYTICRVGVARPAMVREVAAKLHPRYHVRKSKSGRDFVQGNPSKPFDNVNFPGGRPKPGFAPRELCPYRLLRPGAHL